MSPGGVLDRLTAARTCLQEAEAELGALLDAAKGSRDVPAEVREEIEDLGINVSLARQRADELEERLP